MSEETEYCFLVNYYIEMGREMVLNPAMGEGEGFRSPLGVPLPKEKEHNLPRDGQIS